MKLRLDHILGSVSYFLIVKFHKKDRSHRLLYRGGADSDILMKPNSECSEKPVLPGFLEENQA